jgi:hypothetical protein
MEERTMRILGSFAAAALLLALSLPASASAIDTKRADGLTIGTSQATEFSSRHRRWHRRYRSARYYRYRSYRRHYYPGYDAYGYYPYHRPYYYRRYRRGPSFWVGPGGFGFGW